MSYEQAFSGLQTAYSNARPQYPASALGHIKSTIERSEIGPVPKYILDVGCGTGIFTRQLASLWPDTEILGLDVNEDMLSEARSASGGSKIGYRVSPAEELPAGDHSVSAIFAAQAVQWFDRPRFYVECRRTLVDNGWICLIENNRCWRDDAMLDAYEGLLEKYSPNYSRHYRSHDYFKELEDAGFARQIRVSFPWVREMEPEAFVEMTRSSTKMQAALRTYGEEVSSAVNNLVAQHLSSSGQLGIVYETVVILGVSAR